MIMSKRSTHLLLLMICHPCLTPHLQHQNTQCKLCPSMGPNIRLLPNHQDRFFLPYQVNSLQATGHKKSLRSIKKKSTCLTCQTDSLNTFLLSLGFSLSSKAFNTSSLLKRWIHLRQHRIWALSEFNSANQVQTEIKGWAIYPLVMYL